MDWGSGMKPGNYNDNASAEQTSTHAPQSAQASSSQTQRLSTIESASTGQLGTQSPHPVHLPLSTVTAILSSFENNDQKLPSEKFASIDNIHSIQ